MSEKKFWDNFYKKHSSQNFEWLIDYRDLVKSLHLFDYDVSQSLPPSFAHLQTMTFLNLKQKNKNSNLSFLLDVGCGTSMFSFNLKNSFSFKSILICADFSLEALDLLRLKQIDAEKQHNKTLEACQDSLPRFTVDFIQCNCKYLPFRKEVFDLILDKGYLDSLLKSNSANLIDSTLASMSNILEKLDYSECIETKRVLLQITDETPDLRISLFDQFHHKNFRLSYYFKEIELDNSMLYYAYFVYKDKHKA